MTVPGGLLAVLAIVAMALSACSHDQDGRGSASSASPARPSGQGLGGLALSCSGEGQPTVVLESGLDTPGSTFSSLVPGIEDITRVCWYDRAGLGESEELPASAPDPSPARASEALKEVLSEEGIAPPYVVVGWSYGGMVAQVFATEYPELVAGIVLEDSAVREQFVNPWFGNSGWVEAGRVVDEAAVLAELADVDFGDVPVALLTAQQRGEDQIARLWVRFHRHLAALSSNAVHVEALGAGHAIHLDAPDLEVALITEVVKAARTGTPMEPCDGRFAAIDGRCLA